MCNEVTALTVAVPSPSRLVSEPPTILVLASIMDENTFQSYFVRQNA